MASAIVNQEQHTSIYTCCAAVFSYSGRAVFLIFVGCICFGMIDPSLQQYTAYGCVAPVPVCCDALALSDFRPLAVGATPWAS